MDFFYLLANLAYGIAEIYVYILETVHCIPIMDTSRDVA